MLDRLLSGDRRALARLLTLIENEEPESVPLLAALYPKTGRAHLIGVTGAPGTGKSTLVSALAQAYRARGDTVAILAVDPSSPYTGGAILGDRVRMRALAGDAGVFIRSMAARGGAGGMARTAHDAARALDALGFDVVMIETVGAGQSEIEIARLAQTTLVVDAPGLGDDVQAIKAGILEIADVLVVNKADRPGAENTVRALRAMLELGHPAAKDALRVGFEQNGSHPARPLSIWLPPVLTTVALDGRGIDELVAALDAHRKHGALGETWARTERRQLEIELLGRVRDHLLAKLMAGISQIELDALISDLQGRQIDPHTAARRLLAQAEASLSIHHHPDSELRSHRAEF